MYRLYSLAKYSAVFSIAIVLSLSVLFVPNVFAANTCGDTGQAACSTGQECTGVEGEKACTAIDVFGITPVEQIALGQNDLRTTAAQIINVALGLLGIVAVVIILIGGFKWMTAGGNDEQVGEARKWIFSGIIGLAIVLSAWAIASFVLQNLGKATGIEGKFGTKTF